MASFTIQPPFAECGTAGNILVLTGTGTAWAVNTFTVSGGTGASITAQTITGTTSATITLTPGSTSGVLTISDGLGNIQTVQAVVYSLVSSQNWDGVTAPALPVSGYTYNIPGTTSTAEFVSSPNSYDGATTASNFDAICNTIDSASGNVKVSHRQYFSTTTGQLAQVVARRATINNAVRIQYELRVQPGASPGLELQLNRRTSGGATNIGGVGSGTTFTAAAWYTTTLYIHNSTLVVTVQRASDSFYLTSSNTWAAPFAYAIVATDTGITGSGYAGIELNPNGSGTTYSDDFSFYQEANPATGFSFTGPTQGANGSASTNFTVQPNGYLGSNVTVTLSDSSHSGTFSPTTLTFTASGMTTPAAQIFTYTPSVNGVIPISFTNGGGLTNPSAINYLSYTLTQIAANNTAIVWSPGNWKGDTGRGGSVYRQTLWNGAYVRFKFTASANPLCILNLPSSSTGSTLFIRVNGSILTQQAATANISLTSILTASVVNTIEVFVQASPQTSRWNNGTNVVQITGFQIDSVSSVLAQTQTNPWVLIGGDSQTEGIQAGAAGASDATCSWAWILGQGFLNQGIEYCVKACGFQGFLVPGDSGGDVPAWYLVTSGGYQSASSSWYLVDQGVSMLDANGQISAYGAVNTAPIAIICAQGYNDAAQNLTFLQTAVQGWITATRAAAPQATIFQIVPWDLYSPLNPNYNASFNCINAIKAGVAAYATVVPGDKKTPLVDLGQSFGLDLVQTLYTTSFVHPNTQGHGFLSGPIAKAVLPTIFAIRNYFKVLP